MSKWIWLCHSILRLILMNHLADVMYASKSLNRVYTIRTIWLTTDCENQILPVHHAKNILVLNSSIEANRTVIDRLSWLIILSGSTSWCECCASLNWAMARCAPCWYCFIVNCDIEITRLLWTNFDVDAVRLFRVDFEIGITNHLVHVEIDIDIVRLLHEYFTLDWTSGGCLSGCLFLFSWFIQLLNLDHLQCLRARGWVPTLHQVEHANRSHPPQFEE